MTRNLGALVAALGAIAACSSSSAPSSPVTVEDRCRSVCTPAKAHPCAGKDPSECISACLARLQGRDETCQGCVIGFSGFRGETCSCDNAFGSLGSLTCQDCEWRGNGKGCSTSFSSCSVTSACSGFTILPAGDPLCAAQCGEPLGVDAGPDASEPSDASPDTSAEDAGSDAPADAPDAD